MSVEKQTANFRKTSNSNSSSSSISTEIFNHMKKNSDTSLIESTFNFSNYSSVPRNSLKLPTEMDYNFKFGVGDIYSLIFSQYLPSSSSNVASIAVKERRRIRFIKKRIQI